MLALSWGVLSAALTFIFPLVPHLLSGWILFLSDRLILERFVPQAEVGIYAVGASVAESGCWSQLLSGAPSPHRCFGNSKSAEASPTPLGSVHGGLRRWCGPRWSLVLGGDLVRIVTPDQFHGAARVVPWLAAGFLALGL